MASAKRFDVTRTSDTGAIYVRQGLALREARQAVAWCANDNLGWTRAKSAKAGDAIVVGEPFTLGRYVLLIEAAT